MPRTLAQIAEDRRLHAEMLAALSAGSARDIATLRERLAQKKALLEAEEASGPASRAEDRKRNAALIAMLQGGAETGGGPAAAIRKLQEYNALLDAEEGPRAESAAGAAPAPAPAAHIEERRRVMPRNFARERELLNQVIAESTQPRHELPQRHAAIRAQLAKLEEEEAAHITEEAARQVQRQTQAATGRRTPTARTPPGPLLKGEHADFPVWQSKMIEDLANRAAELSAARMGQKYPGLTPEEWMQAKQDVEDSFDKPAGALDVEVIPGIGPVPLSPREILNAQKDPRLAAQIFKSATDRRPLPGEVQDFIARLRQDHPPEKLITAENRDQLLAPFSDHEANMVIHRATLPQELAHAQKLSSNLALPNAGHKEAERLIRQSAAATQGRTKERQADLRKLKQQDIVPRVESELTRARKDPIENIDKYYNPYDKEVVQSLREQAAEDWNERIAPSISGAYAVMGNTRSGAHVAALERAKLKQEKALRGELARLKVHGFESAHESAKGQQKAALDRAQVTGNVGKSQQEHMARAAELSMRDAAAAKTQELLDADAQAKLAASQMQQEQAEKNERIRAAERPLEDEAHGLLLERAMQSGNALPIMPSKTPQAPPPGISPYTFLSGMAGQLGAMAGFPQQQQGMAHGGHAKRKFAGGGLIPSWQELSMQVRPDKYAPQQEKIAEQLQTYNSPFNPMQNWMQHVSAQQLQNLSGDPLAAMGRGAQLAHADQLKYQQHAYDQSRMDKIQAANLYDKMNDSLRHQQHFLADYEAKKAHHLETQRHHGAIEGHSAQALAMKAQKYAMQNQQDFDGMEGEDPYIASMQRKASQLKPTQQKAADEAFKELELGEEVAEKAELGKQLYGRVSTGPIIGHLHPSLASIFGKGSVADRDLAQQLSNDLALQTSQMAKGRGSNMQLGLIQSVKGASTNTPERNLLSMKAIKNKGKDTSHVARQRLYRLGFSKKEIDAYLAGRPKTTLEDPTVPAKGDHKSHANDLSSIGDEELMRMYQVAQ